MLAKARALHVTCIAAVYLANYLHGFVVVNFCYCFTRDALKFVHDSICNTKTVESLWYLTRASSSRCLH